MDTCLVQYIGEITLNKNPWIHSFNSTYIDIIYITYYILHIMLYIYLLEYGKRKNKWSLRILPSGRPLRVGVRKGG